LKIISNFKKGENKMMSLELFFEGSKTCEFKIEGKTPKDLLAKLNEMKKYLEEAEKNTLYLPV